MERVSFAADELFPNSLNHAGAKTGFGTLRAEYDLGGAWTADLSGLLGQDTSRSNNYGVRCASCLILGLNGTTNVAGRPDRPDLPTRSGPARLRRQPAADGRQRHRRVKPGGDRTGTSAAAFRRQLLEQHRFLDACQRFQNALKLVVGGPAFTLPGGQVRVSAGAEALRYTMRQHMVRDRQRRADSPRTPSPPTSEFTRKVYALFAETVVPLVGPDNAIPGVQRLNLSGAVRYDHYDGDVGGTTNPKVAAEWGAVDGLSFRGAYGTSFTAPALTSRGDDVFGITTDSTSAPRPADPAGRLPRGQHPAPAARRHRHGRVQHRRDQRGPGHPAQRRQPGPEAPDRRHLVARRDWRPSFLSGFRISVTYWAAKYKGLIAAPSFSQVVASPGLNDALIINPTAAQIAAATAGLRQTTALPTNINFIYSFQQRNLSNLDASGIDLDARYAFPTGFGDWRSWARRSATS